MLRSLRARLLAWYSLVLVAVLAIFASVAVWTVWRSSLRDVDGRLMAVASQLARAVNLDPSGQYEVNLAGEDLAELGAADGGPYYVVWTTSGALIDRSDPGVDVSFPGAPQSRLRSGNREVVVRGNQGAVVLVGQSLAGLRADLWSTVLGFAAAGIVALALALLGGGFLAGRALAPIGRIAQTAEAMSESNLGLRIDINRTEDELGRVAVALNRAFDRLQQAFERQTRFTADASHELRTPLASMLAELEWAQARPRSDAEYRHALEICTKAAERMRSVVESLLTLARADADPTPLRQEPVNLAALAHETVASVRPIAASRGVTIEVSGDSAIVSGDAHRLRELISNLVLNAVQHNHPGGTVTCSISVANGTTSLEVADSGPGIDPQDLPHIFERFYRANKARSRAAGGVGLGLAISKWIADSHGARIRCESRKGRGSSFTVDFPTSAVTTSPQSQG
jgi:heavy metal sensor kinase